MIRAIVVVKLPSQRASLDLADEARRTTASFVLANIQGFDILQWRSLSQPFQSGYHTSKTLPTRLDLPAETAFRRILPSARGRSAQTIAMPPLT
jgi:hypothetical protein